MTLFFRRRDVRLERAAGHRRGDRTLEPVLAHRRDTKDPIVDADVLKNELMSRAVHPMSGWRSSAIAHDHNRNLVLGVSRQFPLCRVRSTPLHLVIRSARSRLPSKTGVGRN